MITGAARLAGVVGWPVTHSLSPVIHNAWIRAAGLDAAYVPFAVPPERLGPFIEGFRSGAVSGLNVTAPHKKRAWELADARSDVADLAEAANLLLMAPSGREVFAHSTDGEGMLSALAEQAPEWRAGAGPVLVLGAGGAAESAVPALLAAGVPQVRVAARNGHAARGMIERWDDKAAAYPLADLSTALQDVTLVLNATSAGLNGQGELPALLGAPASAVVMDMVYRPLRTTFLVQAAARGHRTVDGLAMLIGQARPSFEALFGVPAPESVDVRRLCLQALSEAP